MAKPLYITNSAGIAYHQYAVLYLIKPQEDLCTLTRDDILAKGEMIYRLMADDIPSLRLG